MNRLLSTTAMLALSLATPVVADPAFMLGFGLSFGGGQDPELGVTGQVLSSNRPDDFVGAAGATYFFGKGGYWGANLGAGYTFDRSAVTLTYDFLNRRPQFSLGAANIDEVC